MTQRSAIKRQSIIRPSASDDVVLFTSVRRQSGAIASFLCFLHVLFIYVFRFLGDAHDVCMITQVGPRLLNVLDHRVDCLKVRVRVNGRQRRMPLATRASVSIRRVFNLLSTLHYRTSVLTAYVRGSLNLIRADLYVLHEHINRQLSAGEVKTTRQCDPGVCFYNFSSGVVR